MLLTQSPELRAQPSAHLTQTMRLLEMNAVDLAEEIARALETNPALQLVEEIRCPNCGRRVRALPCAACLSQRAEDADGAPIVFLSPRLPDSFHYRDDESDALPEESIAQAESLAEHLLRQVACATNEAEQRIAVGILSRLDECGLLAEHPAELALALNAPLETVRRVLGLIQRADPVGVATRDLRESLLIQIEVLSEGGMVHPLAERIVTDCWDPLAKRSYAAIARSLRVPLRDVKSAVQFIRRNLTPYPARAWQDSGRGISQLARDVYYHPDIVISHNPRPGGPLMVEVFTGVGGVLRVDPEIRASVSQSWDNGNTDSADWHAQIEQAMLIAKCFQQRNNTMLRIAEIITVEQKAFVLGGDADLKPLTRSMLAKRLNLHESTVSRAVANKAAALPNGRIVPLSIFFDRSLAVRDAVQHIVENESPSAPLSDTEIAKLLKPQGHKVARRTVAKYRQMLGILPANLRARELTSPLTPRPLPPLLLGEGWGVRSTS